MRRGGDGEGRGVARKDSTLYGGLGDMLIGRRRSEEEYDYV